MQFLRALIMFVVGVFHVCATLALFFGLYLGYTRPSADSDPGTQISDSAIHGAKESIGVVENVGKWFGEQISYESISKSNPRAGRALILIPEILIYYPAWAGAGAGGAIGGVIGDIIRHGMHSAAHSTSVPASPAPDTAIPASPVPAATTTGSPPP